MSERNGKAFSQDVVGFVFVLLGGFFAVSAVLFLVGQEPKPGWVSSVTFPVVELVALLGPWAALLLSLGVAALGSALFLGRTAIAPGRPLAALTVAALGLAFLLGAFARGGEFGTFFPGLVAGFGGRALAAVLGLALLWISYSLQPLAQPRAKHPSDAVQRISLAARHDAGAGVSPAEAALLVTEPRTAPRATARREEAPHKEPARKEPLRDSTLRPYTAAKEAPRPAPKPAPVASAVRPLTPARPAAPAAPENVAPAVLPAPLTPSWELEESLPLDEAELETVRPLELPLAAEDAPEEPRRAPEPERGSSPAPSALAAFEAEFGDEPEADELTAELAEEQDEDLEKDLEKDLDEADEAAPGSVLPPAAAWEQVELFAEEDEEEELEEEAAPAKPVRAELTPSFDFDSAASSPAASSPAAHEPEPVEDPFADEPVAEVSPRAPAKPAARTAPEPERTLAPRPAPARKAAPAEAVAAVPGGAEGGDDEGSRWSQLVYEAGCAILEQNRVAVSMIQRRFGVDFEQACRVLDELQEAGLIGPFMGGRTRDILLSREQWLAHAPHAS